jgi:hypothetical protein
VDGIRCDELIRPQYRVRCLSVSGGPVYSGWNMAFQPLMGEPMITSFLVAIVQNSAVMPNEFKTFSPDSGVDLGKQWQPNLLTGGRYGLKFRLASTHPPITLGDRRWR